jgi:hypothetical protein
MDGISPFAWEFYHAGGGGNRLYAFRLTAVIYPLINKTVIYIIRDIKKGSKEEK